MIHPVFKTGARHLRDVLGVFDSHTLPPTFTQGWGFPVQHDQDVIQTQLSYYRERAGEYDEWFFRRGRYDRGAEHRAEWFREIGTVESHLLPMVRDKEVVEFAAGTGLWTKRLLDAGACRILAIDGSPEVLEINRARTSTDAVEYEIADVFAWNPTRVFDIVFFSFWLSHVPQSRFEAFWSMVRRSLRPDGQVLFVDSLLEQTSTATDHKAVDASGIAHRKLNDGREFQIVKVFHDPATLQSRLAQLGWNGRVQSSGKFFLFGSMEIQADDTTPAISET